MSIAQKGKNIGREELSEALGVAQRGFWDGNAWAMMADVNLTSQLGTFLTNFQGVAKAIDSLGYIGG